jgi:protein SCO1/2
MAGPQATRKRMKLEATIAGLLTVGLLLAALLVGQTPQAQDSGQAAAVAPAAHATGHAAHGTVEGMPPTGSMQHGAGTAPLAAGVDAAEQVVVDFELLDRTGRNVRDEDFRGRYLLLGFGFTNCPHICPMMAFNMGQALQATDREAAGVFVSVDTERDDAATADDYAARFGERMLGLGGRLEQINAAAKNFKVSYAVTKTQNTYTVQHTATIYLIGPDGNLLDTFAVSTPAAEIVAAML